MAYHHARRHYVNTTPGRGINPESGAAMQHNQHKSTKECLTKRTIQTVQHYSSTISYIHTGIKETNNELRQEWEKYKTLFHLPPQ